MQSTDRPARFTSATAPSRRAAQSPRLRADCQVPAGDRELRPLSDRERWTKHMFLGRGTVTRYLQKQGISGVPMPNLRGIDPVPMGAFAGPQQIVYGGRVAP